MDSKDYSYLKEEKIDGAQIFDGKVVNLHRDRVRLPNGHEGVREVIRHVGAVCVIPVFDNGDVLIEHQFRYPHDKVLIEIPAGKLPADVGCLIINAETSSAISRAFYRGLPLVSRIVTVTGA